jgi:hypothetical protein
MTPTTILRNFKQLTKFNYVGLPISMREQLTANRTYYVRTDGSDSNNGLANTSGGAFLTIQKAINVVCGNLDLGQWSVTIQVGDGTYTQSLVLYNWIGAGNVSIIGNETTPSNVTISTASNGFNVDGLSSIWYLSGMRITTSAGSSISISRGSVLRFQNLDFGSTPGNHFNIGSDGTIIVEGNYRISGGATNRHFANFGGSVFFAAAATVTVTGTPAFTQFAIAHRGARIIANATVTYSGAATGQRYEIRHNSVVFTAGVATSTFFPGSTAGAVADGGAIYS